MSEPISSTAFFKHSVYLSLTGMLFLGLLLTTGGMVFYYQFKAAKLQEEALREQRMVAAEIADGIGDYLRVAVQLSRSITALVSPLRTDREQVETLLLRMLQSAPKEMIYGIGAWYEPGIFSAETRLFGPYAHRGDPPDHTTVLTYEWNGEDYYYPRQPWYLAGKQAHGATVFTEPYFDTDMVYMSASRAFFDEQGHFIGVTTVDMVLPLLQDYVAKFNDRADRSVYVLTAGKKIFLHPQADSLLRLARDQGLRPNTVLDLDESLLKTFQTRQHTQQILGRETVPTVDWTVTVGTDRAVLFADQYRLRRGLTWIVGGLWALFLIALLMLAQAHKARVRNNLLREELRERKRKEMLLKEMNEALEVKIRERTAELEAANREITQLNHWLHNENQRMGTELAITRRLQQMVLPNPEELENVADLDIAGFMEPASEVGGDYFDVLRQDDHVIIGVGDVTGHGLESGVVMLMVQMAVRTLLAHQVTDGEVFLDVVNRALFENIQRMNCDKNLTLAVLDYVDGKITLCGQHEELLVVREHGAVERIDTLDLGFMVGFQEDIHRFLASREIHLAPGDGIVLYTDGVTEAHDNQDEMYGLDRLCAAAQTHWQGSAAQAQQGIVNDFLAFVGDRSLDDDVTLLVVKRKAS